MAVGQEYEHGSVAIYVEGSTAGTYIKVGGSDTAKLTRSTGTYDITNEDSDGWEESIPNIRNWGLEVSGFVPLNSEAHGKLDNDWTTNGYQKIQFKSVSGNMYTGKTYITDFPYERAEKSTSAIKYNLTLKGTGALAKSAVSTT
jgi:predicted secreted protein